MSRWLLNISTGSVGKKCILFPLKLENSVYGRKVKCLAKHIFRETLGKLIKSMLIKMSFLKIAQLKVSVLKEKRGMQGNLKGNV